MNAVVKWSVILAGLVAALSVLIAVTGMHKNPITGGLVAIGLAILINVVVVFLALRQTARDNTYVQQLLNGVLIGAIAGVLIFLSSWLMLSVVFPNYMEEMREGAIAFLESIEVPDAQFDAQIEKLEQMTPLSQAVPGLIGTFFTSLFVAAIVGIFQRKK
jgi:hypothetical protein